MKTSGLLTRLSLAWSRDGAKKFYVQDRMREVGRELWTWLADGANVYICGDAKRMAKDVERALVDIVAQFGARSTDEAISFRRGAEEEGPVPAGRVLIPAILCQIGRIKFSAQPRRGECFSAVGAARSTLHHYFWHRLVRRPAIFHIARWGDGDPPCANYRRKPACICYARSLSGRAGQGLHLVALYSAFAIIAAMVFGTLSVHLF